MFEPSAPPPVRKAGNPPMIPPGEAETADVGCGVKEPPEPGAIALLTELKSLGIMLEIVDICLSYQNVSVSFICRVVGKMRNNCAAFCLGLNINV
jgi:hypothetical protein